MSTDFAKQRRGLVAIGVGLTIMTFSWRFPPGQRSPAWRVTVYVVGGVIGLACFGIGFWQLRRGQR